MAGVNHHTIYWKQFSYCSIVGETQPTAVMSGFSFSMVTYPANKRSSK